MTREASRSLRARASSSLYTSSRYLLMPSGLLIGARNKLVGQRVTLENPIRGLVVVFGARLPAGAPRSLATSAPISASYRVATNRAKSPPQAASPNAARVRTLLYESRQRNTHTQQETAQAEDLGLRDRKALDHA
jgi:hypothetical protein